MIKHAKNTIKFCVVLLGISVPLLLPSVARAAVLYLEPSSGEYHQGETFIIEARIDTEDECINTIKADLSFSQDVLEAVDFSSGNSILVLWVSLPNINQSQGLISFIGGIPGGYCGRMPGDPGTSNSLGKVIFKVSNQIQISKTIEVKFLDTSQVLLNDGFGTPAKLTTKGAIFNILTGIPEFPKDEWQAELKEDNIPPEPFEIEIHQDPSIFEGKYFLIFSTTDKQTGINNYEICEVPPRWTLKTTQCTMEKSPYLLKDQSLKSVIRVKALDKAGNERIAEYLPPTTPFPYWTFLRIIVILIITGWIIQKYFRKKQQ